MRATSLLGPALAVLLLACGGASHPAATTASAAPARGLAYTDPSGSGWRLLRDAASTDTHLLLNLVGPAGQKGRGIGFNLRSDGSVAFARFGNGTFVRDLGVFLLGSKSGALDVNGAPVTTDVPALVGGVKEQGALLSVGAYQRDRRFPAVDLASPLIQVAIDFDPQATGKLKAGARIPLTFVRARAIPEDIGDNPEDPAFDPATVIFKYRIDDVSIAVGTLTTK